MWYGYRRAARQCEDVGSKYNTITTPDMQCEMTPMPVVFANKSHCHYLLPSLEMAVVVTNY